MASFKIIFMALLAIIYRVHAQVTPCRYPDWVKGTQYCEGEKVTSGHSEWMAKWCNSEEPARKNPQGQTSAWNRIRFCRRATTHIQAAARSTTPSCDVQDWVQGTQYCKGDEVLYQNIQWIAKWCNFDSPGNVSPENTTSAWTSEGLCDPICTADVWVKGTQYCAGDNAVNNGVQWQAKWCTFDEPADESPFGTTSAWIKIGPCTMPSGTSARVRTNAKCM